MNKLWHNMDEFDPVDHPSEWQMYRHGVGTATVGIFLGLVLFVALAFVIGGLTFIVTPVLTMLFSLWLYGQIVDGECKRNHERRLKRSR